MPKKTKLKKENVMVNIRFLRKFYFNEKIQMSAEDYEKIKDIYISDYFNYENMSKIDKKYEKQLTTEPANYAKHIVSSRAEFEEAISLFQLYQPIKIARELKEDFHQAISSHFINMGIEKWSATIYPLKKSYKFKRT